LARLRVSPVETQDVAHEATGPLLPIELYTVSGHQLGWMGPVTGRTSDQLNGTDPLRVAELHEANGDTHADREVIDEDHGLNWSEPERDELLFVVPPPLLAPNRHLRLHRRLEEISLDVGPFTITGLVHIRPGSEVGDFIFHSNRRFLPLTRVEVRQDDEPNWWRSFGVVIVNTSCLTWLSGRR